MGIVSAKQLTEALQKARSVGLVEETFTLEECEITLRNLRPDEYEAVVQECTDLEDVAYLNKWQEGHVCRAIVQINGSDLRDTDFVEGEEPDPKNKGAMKNVKRELHDWLRKNILSTWGKEAIFTAYRKFTDVVFLAEKRAKEGVTFTVAEETAEDKFRRLLGELKEIESEVPPALLKAALEEHGYTFYTQPQDAEAVRNLEASVPPPPGPGSEGGSTPAAAAPATPPAAPPAAPSAPPVAARPQQPVQQQQPATDPATRAAQIMRQRVPMNQTPVNVPDLPVAPTNPEEAVFRAVVPGVPQHRIPAGGVDLNGSLDMSPPTDDMRAAIPVPVLPPGMAPPPNMPPGTFAPAPSSGDSSVAMLDQRGVSATDPRQIATIVNKPPVSGLNPKYRPHGR